MMANMVVQGVEMVMSSWNMSMQMVMIVMTSSNRAV